jgi:AcrR family transcriptional regulator
MRGAQQPSKTQAADAKPGAAKRPSYRLGLREEARIARRRRVLEAAEALFHEKGLEATGMREIASRAEVGIGTIFLYAPDKRGLLLLIHNEQLRLCHERAFATLDVNADLVDQIVHVFRENYLYLARDTRLSLQAMQEASYFSRADRHIPELEAADYVQRKAAARKRLGELVRAHQLRGSVSADIDPVDVVEVSMSIYVSEVREWLTSIEMVSPFSVDLVSAIGLLRRRIAFALAGTIAHQR